MNASTAEHLKLTVTAVTNIADDVIEVSFGHPDGADLPSWDPGAHIEVTLPSGVARQYSLCSDPANRTVYTIAVLRDVNGRGGSKEFHEAAATDAEFTIRLPRNNFALVEAESYLFVGGGIGITPLIPMIDRARERGARWQLAYGGKRASSMAYRQTLISHGDTVDVWIEEERGYPDLPAILHAAPAGTVVYTCGPSVMIDAVVAEHGRHPHLGALHFERFSASGPIDTGGSSFEVELRMSGVTLTVGEDSTILEEVRKVVANQEYSCEEGYCGECETRVLEGEPDHRDDYLMPEQQDANDRIMICVSRCTGSRLVLDL